MWVRNYLGKMIYFNEHLYSTNQEKYKALWKIKYNVDFKSKKALCSDNLSFLTKISQRVNLFSPYFIMSDKPVANDANVRGKRCKTCRSRIDGLELCHGWWWQT